MRVPAISLKMSDIPPDDFSWRKYGQKPIKGSPHPRFDHFLVLILKGVNLDFKIVLVNVLISYLYRICRNFTNPIIRNCIN